MRILIVEDEAKVAAFLQQALIEAGYAADIARNGEEGFRFALATNFDLVILDWLLPLRSGVDVCRGLRAAGKSYPILMLTARAAVQDRIDGLDHGADDYLTKPFALGELMARVRSLLRRTTSSAHGVLQAGDLVLDPAAHRVSRAGHEIVLSAREYALLEYLMRNAGRTLTRTMIIEHVWDFNFDCGTNVVDVYINYLRNKIDRRQPSGDPLIHTIRGVGYRLEVMDRSHTGSSEMPSSEVPRRFAEENQ